MHRHQMRVFAVGEIRIHQDLEKDALAALKRSFLEQYGWKEPDSFYLALHQFALFPEKDGAIYRIKFGGDRDIIEDEAFFSSFSNFLTRGSYVQYATPDGEVWRFVEQRGRLVRKEPKW